MKKTIQLLTVLLAAQLLLALALNVHGDHLTAHAVDAPLLALAGKAPDHIIIEGKGEGAGAGDKKVELTKTDAGWVLPGEDGFPADPAKVKQFLDKLKALKHGLPAATTSAAQKRFKVADDAFERRIRLTAGTDTLATLYLGTTPGARRVNARRDGDDGIYAVSFAVYDAPLNPASWQNSAILEVPKSDIVALQLPEVTLRRDEQGEKAHWAAEKLASGETVAVKAADTLVNQLATLRIGSVLGHDAQADYHLDKPALQWAVTLKDEKTVKYQLGKRKDDYVLKSTRRPEYFELPKYTGDALVTAASREKLVTAATQHGAKDDKGVVSDKQT